MQPLPVVVDGSGTSCGRGRTLPQVRSAHCFSSELAAASCAGESVFCKSAACCTAARAPVVVGRARSRQAAYRCALGKALGSPGARGPGSAACVVATCSARPTSRRRVGDTTFCTTRCDARPASHARSSRRIRGRDGESASGSGTRAFGAAPTGVRSAAAFASSVGLWCSACFSGARCRCSPAKYQPSGRGDPSAPCGPGFRRPAHRSSDRGHPAAPQPSADDRRITPFFARAAANRRARWHHASAACSGDVR